MMSRSTQQPGRRTPARRVLVAGTLILAVAVGIGRFAYTPILPYMREHADLSVASAGGVASANLFGYLLGALASMSSFARARRRRLVVGSVITVIAMTAAMAIASLPLWIVVRFLTGVASGFAFVLGSSIVLDRAAAEGEKGRRWMPIFYGGVGIGIAFTGVAVPVFAAVARWQGAWLGLAATAAVACVLLVPEFRDDVSESRAAGRANGGANRALFPWLLAAYGGEGFGYIIPATFMVAMIASDPPLARFAHMSWIVVGLVAAPSVYLWVRASGRIGAAPAMAAALAIQTAGVAAAAVAPGTIGDSVGALSLGATFMGVSALGVGLGRAMFADRSHVAIGSLTVAFGLGQIAGPFVAARLAAARGDFRAALVAAIVVLSMSTASMLVGLFVTRTAARCSLPIDRCPRS